MNVHAPRSWRARAAAHLALARISNAPTVISNVLAGAALSGVLRPAFTPVGEIALLALAMFLYYTAGMYLNDLFDIEIDRRERPERPLPSGVLSRGEALGVTVLLFGVGTFLLALLGPAPLICGLLLIVLIIVYDAWHKTNALSPLLMASTRVMVYVTAFVAFAPAVRLELIFWGGLLALYIVGLTYIAKTETHSLTGYWPAALVLLPALIGAVSVSWLELWLPLAQALWVTYCVSFVYLSRQIGRAIAGLIAGVSLLDALVILLFGTTGGLVWALIAFGVTLSLQRYVRGT